MKISWKKIIPWAILVISLWFMYSFISRHLTDLKKLTEIHTVDFVILSVFVALFTIANGLKNVIILKPYGINLRMKEWVGLSIVNTFWNYLPFQGGLLAKGAYLKRQHQFSYVDYGYTVVASYFLTFIVLGLAGCLGLAINCIYTHHLAASVLVIYSTLWVIPLGVILFSFSSTATRLPWPWLQKFIQGIHVILRQRKIIFFLVLVDIAIVLIYSLRLYVASRVLGFPIPLLFYFLVAPISLLSIFTAITPGGLVVREAAIGLFASWLTVSVTQSVVASVLDRGVSMLWIFTLGPICNYFLARRFVRQSPVE